MVLPCSGKVFLGALEMEKQPKFWWALPTAHISHSLPNISINHVATICEFSDDFGWNLDLLAASLPIHVVDVIINIKNWF